MPPDAPERITEDTLESFAVSGVEVPTAVEQVIFKGLAVRAEERFQNMTELREALEQAVLTADNSENDAKNNAMHFINKNKKIIGIVAACIVLIFGGMGIYHMTHDHAYGEWEVVEEANCTETGMQKRKCSCGAVEKEELLVQHQLEVVPAVAATCTESGLTEGSVCSLCGFVEAEQSVVDALGHNIVADAAVEATCIEPGHSEGSHCSTCGEIVTASETVAALGHSFSENICERCGVEKWWAEIWTEKDTYHTGEEVKVEMYIYTNEPNAVITPYDAILVGVSGDGTSYEEYIELGPWEGEFGNGEYLSSKFTLGDDIGLYAYGLMDAEGNAIGIHVFTVVD